MRATLIAVCLVLTSSAAFSQEAVGSIFGILSDNLARLVASAPMTAKNVDAGMIFRIQSGSAGLYRFTGLPVGTYEVTVDITSAGAGQLCTAAENPRYRDRSGAVRRDSAAALRDTLAP